MTILDHKIDFVVTFTVKDANPNGDPLSANLPRTDLMSYGEMSDVCIKRKIRNRLQDEGYPIFVQARDRVEDDQYSLEARYKANIKELGSKPTDQEIFNYFCEKWMDTRSFGQVVTFNNLSIGIRGPVSISLAKSLSPVVITTMQITRSTDGMASTTGKKSSDTMGSKSFVEFGVYQFCGSINPYFAEKTGFSNEDAQAIKEALRTLFINDASSARPDGSMEVKEVFWFEHPSKLGLVSSAKIHQLVQSAPDFDPNNPAEDYDLFHVHLDEEKARALEEKGLKIEVMKGY